ncbi:MAG TPA: hypothetical protein VIU37_06325, partial [Candidatus Limnocylindrales bacterium]
MRTRPGLGLAILVVVAACGGSPGSAGSTPTGTGATSSITPWSPAEAPASEPSLASPVASPALNGSDLAVARIESI